MCGTLYKEGNRRNKKLEFGFIDLIAGIACGIGYIRGRKKGILPALFAFLSVGVGVFMFYRLGNFYEYLAQRFNTNIVHGLGMVATVVVVVLVFRLLGIFIDKFFDIRPNLGITEIVAGLIGLLSGLLWTGVFTRAFYYLNLWGFRRWVADSVTYKFILPIPNAVYGVIAKVLQLITPGGV
ncbi:MAG: CvpA family protein [Candidatus Kaelpia aquatica]|nr:CvpA family protein [Candidatus Kaelpia aquatica]